MTVRSVIAGRPPSRWDVGSCVRTKTGLEGEVIGLAEFVTGWEYRIKIPSRKRTLFRKEEDLRPCR